MKTAQPIMTHALGAMTSTTGTVLVVMLLSWLNGGAEARQPADRIANTAFQVAPQLPKPVAQRPRPQRHRPTRSAPKSMEAAPQLSGMAGGLSLGLNLVGQETPAGSAGDGPGSGGPAGNATSPAVPLDRPAPRFPAAAQRAGISGSVMVAVDVDERGRVKDARVVRSQPQGVFDQAALEAVRTWRFAPARNSAGSVASTVRQTLRFALE